MISVAVNTIMIILFIVVKHQRVMVFLLKICHFPKKLIRCFLSQASKDYSVLDSPVPLGAFDHEGHTRKKHILGKYG
mgnify:CR=1 FL=1